MEAALRRTKPIEALFPARETHLSSLPHARNADPPPGPGFPVCLRLTGADGPRVMAKGATLLSARSRRADNPGTGDKDRLDRRPEISLTGSPVKKVGPGTTLRPSSLPSAVATTVSSRQPSPPGTPTSARGRLNPSPNNRNALEHLGVSRVWTDATRHNAIPPTPVPPRHLGRRCALRRRLTPPSEHLRKPSCTEGAPDLQPRIAPAKRYPGSIVANQECFERASEPDATADLMKRENSDAVPPGPRFPAPPFNHDVHHRDS